MCAADIASERFTLPTTRGQLSRAASVALAAAAADLRDGLAKLSGVLVDDDQAQLVASWLDDRAELLAAATGSAPRCAVATFGRCYAAPVVDGLCAEHAADNAAGGELGAVVHQLRAVSPEDDGAADELRDYGVRMRDVSAVRIGPFAGDELAGLVVDDSGSVALGVAVVAGAWLAAAASWAWLATLAVRGLVGWWSA